MRHGSATPAPGSRSHTIGGPEVERCLTHLAVDRKVSASTQSQALSALLFLYKQAPQVELPWLDNVVRAKASKRLPVVLTAAVVRSVLANLRGEYWLDSSLLYGSGLRLMESPRLRVKDVNFACSEVLVRDGKGSKGRVTPSVTRTAGSGADPVTATARYP